MNEIVAVELTLGLSAIIVVGLIFTHFYAGHKIKGLLYAAIGLTTSSVGYAISILLTPLPLFVYFANILFAGGLLLFYISTQRLVERKLNYLEIALVILVFASALAFFQFVYAVVMIRQIIVSLTVIYIASRQVYLIYRHLKTHPITYLLSYLVLACAIILLQIVRLLLIAFGVNNNLVPNTTITANILILIITASVFILLALILLSATSIFTRHEMQKERFILEEWSTTDYLTKMPNRRKLYSYINEKIEKGEPFAVIISDLDGFKQINDTHGHPVGDAVLQAYAQVIDNRKKPETFLARFGGDEFVTVISNYIDDSSLALEIPLSVNLKNFVVDNRKFNFDLRSSAGVAVFPNDGTTIGELLKNADYALYAIKVSNRNHVGFYHNLNK